LTQDRRSSPSASDSRTGLRSGARQALFTSLQGESITNASARSSGRRSRTPLGDHASAPTPLFQYQQSSPASCTCAAAPLTGFSPHLGPSPRFSPLPPHPPLGAPRMRRPPPHVLVANAAHPRLGVPHPWHIHHRLPNMLQYAPIRRGAARGLAAQPSDRKCIGDGKAERTTVALCVPSPRKDGRRAPRTPHEVRCRPAGARMTLDRETRGLPASISLSAVYLKTLRSRAGAARAHGVPQLHRARTTQKGETRCCVHIQPLILPGGSVSLLRDDWYQLRRDKCCGMTTAVNVYRNTPSPAQHSASAPPISLPPHCTTFSSTAGALRPPTFSTSHGSASPHSYLQTRSLPSTLSAAWAPAIRDGYGVLNPESDGVQIDREVWGGSAYVQALPRHGGRRMKNNGMGREAVEVPARRSRAEPPRTKLALGGRCGVGDPGASRVGWRMRGVHVCGGGVAPLLWSPTTLGSHHIAFFSIYPVYTPVSSPLRLLYFPLHAVHPSKNLLLL
jgi:hypothetical protein